MAEAQSIMFVNRIKGRGVVKKFHDIKKRTRKNPEPQSEVSWLDTFWHGTRSDPVKKRRNHHVILTSKRLFLSVLLVAMAMTITGRAYVVKADLTDSIGLAKVHLGNSLAMLDHGEYDQALAECSLAKIEIDKIRLNLQSWGQNSEYLRIIDYRSDIVSAEMLVASVDQVLDIANSTKNLIESLSSEMTGQQIIPGQEMDFSINIDRLKNHLDQKSKQITELNEKLSKLKTSDSFISSSDRQKIVQAFVALESEITGVRNNIIPLLEWYSGEGKDRKIMLLLQNNAELRGSGGFIGSYAVLETASSAIKRIDFQTNIYKLDNAVKGKLGIASPPEYDVLSQGNLYLRDANYAVNGPESFAEVMKMYKLESGKDLDGTIAIDTSFVTSLLRVTGPIDMPAYGMQITADNFLTEVQTEVEYDYFQRSGGKVENEPKKILAEMMPKLVSATLDKLKSPNERIEIIKALKEAVGGKHLMFYSNQNDVQLKIKNLNIGGALAEGDFDFFMSHSTNIGGGKSSLNIDEAVNDTIVIGDDGTIEHSLELERHHTGDGVYPDFDNLNLVRIVIPKGSEISEFNQIQGNFWPHMDKKRSQEIDHYSGSEGGKDKLSFWMNTKPGGTSKATFVFKSAYKPSISGRDTTYRLYLQKQAGTKVARYHITVKYPKSWNFIANYVHADLHYDIDLDTDKLLELKFER